MLAGEHDEGRPVLLDYLIYEDYILSQCPSYEQFLQYE